jgi:hypothetical protein
MSLSKFDLKLTSPKKEDSPMNKQIRKAQEIASSGGYVSAIDPLISNLAEIFIKARVDANAAVLGIFLPVSNDNAKVLAS